MSYIAHDHYHRELDTIQSILCCPLCQANNDSLPPGHEQGGIFEEFECDSCHPPPPHPPSSPPLPSQLLDRIHKEKRRRSLQAHTPAAPATFRLEINYISGGVRKMTRVTILQSPDQQPLPESQDSPNSKQAEGHTARRESSNRMAEVPPSADRLAIGHPPPSSLPPLPPPRATKPLFRYTPRSETTSYAAIKGPPRRGDIEHLREMHPPARPSIPEEEVAPRDFCRIPNCKKCKRGSESLSNRRKEASSGAGRASGESLPLDGKRPTKEDRIEVTWNHTEVVKPQERSGPSIPEGAAPRHVSRKTSHKKSKKGGSSSKRREEETPCGAVRAAGESLPFDSRQPGEKGIAIIWNHTEVKTPQEGGGSSRRHRRASGDKGRGRDRRASGDKGRCGDRRASKDKGSGGRRRASKDKGIGYQRLASGDKGSGGKDGGSGGGYGFGPANPDIASGGCCRPNPIERGTHGDGGYPPASPRDISGGYRPSPRDRGARVEGAFSSGYIPTPGAPGVVGGGRGSTGATKPIPPAAPMQKPAPTNCEVPVLANRI